MRPKTVQFQVILKISLAFWFIHFNVNHIQSKWILFCVLLLCINWFFFNIWQVDSIQVPQIILSHETFNSVGSWAITPILASSTEYINNIRFSSSHDSNAVQKTDSPQINVTTSAAAASATSTSVPSDKVFGTKWLILCEDQSIVDLKALINNLKNEDYTKVSNTIPMRCIFPLLLFLICSRNIAI